MRIFHETVSIRGYLLVSLLGIGAATVLARPPIRPASVPTIAVDVTEPAPPTEPRATHEELPPVNDIKLVFSDAGVSYLALEDLDALALPRHGRFSTTKDAVTTSALVTTAHLPSSARAWIDRAVIVDGVCETKVVGFAIVAQVSGDPDPAGVGDEGWTARTLLDHGHVMLAAKLDRCTGTFARAASAPAIRPFVEVGGGNVEEAHRRLIESAPGAAAAKEWASFEQAGQWFEHIDLSTRTVRDPQSGRIWISIHGHAEFTCGGPNINIWGLFRVEDNGELTTVQLRALGTLVQIDQLVDTNGDGIPELVGRGWISPDAMITTAAGAELVRLDTPFFGCGC